MSNSLWKNDIDGYTESRIFMIRYNMISSPSPFSFAGFDGREESLKNIKRYSVYPVMFYRTDLWIHCHRIFWIIETLIPFAIETFPTFDVEKARTLAFVHDDAEIITTDINLYHKIQMTKKELGVLANNEQRAIETLSAQWPKVINGFNYKQLLLHALKKDCIEAQFVSFVDKLDAYGESFHETLAGNTYFILHKELSPVNVYTSILSAFPTKYPALKNLFSHKHPLLKELKTYDVYSITKHGKPHTELSISNKRNIPHYDFWKDLTIDRLGEAGVKLLTTQQEFLS